MKLSEKIIIAGLIVFMVIIAVVLVASMQDGTTNPDASTLNIGDYFTVTNVRYEHVITGTDVNGVRLGHEEFSFDLRALRDVHNVKIYSGDIDTLRAGELVSNVGDMQAGDVRYIPTFTSYWLAQIRCEEIVGNFDLFYEKFK